MQHEFFKIVFINISNFYFDSNFYKNIIIKNKNIKIIVKKKKKIDFLAMLDILKM